jgi:tRNA (cytidine/uridine-2'-O-)-methyltransferase
MKVVLVHPQIPQNTGNIARTCAAANAKLVLVRPLGFSLSDRQMKRAGLDYWDRVAVETIEDLDAWLIGEKSRSVFFFSSKATASYTEASFTDDAILIFGSETEGLPEALWQKYPTRFFTIPMADGQRCLTSPPAPPLFSMKRSDRQAFRRCHRSEYKGVIRVAFNNV